MSEVRVNNIVDYGGKGAPTFDNGAVISGVSSLGSQAKIGSNVTITSGGINVSGVTTAATLSGNLTGDVNSGFVTATSAVIGSGVTINAGGLNITGVMTATTFEGDGSTMTGVAMTIAPLAYNPDVSDSIVPKATGIGITFDHRILAGSGNITLSIATNAGAAGTTVENFGVGSSVTIAGRSVSIDPTSDLNFGETYHISYPSGAFTNTSGDVDYVGTAYTFGVKAAEYQLWVWGRNNQGQLGQNAPTSSDRSSPVQIPGITWSKVNISMAIKNDGSLWAWGQNDWGQLGKNNTTNYSSPIQIGSETTWNKITFGYDDITAAIKTDGTLWTWGKNDKGQLGDNSVVSKSSPVQIPGTTWNFTATGDDALYAVKTDGTLWSWGANQLGELGHNNTTRYSSPTQIPGTTWNSVTSSVASAIATKTDGTAWSWGFNEYGQLMHNNQANYPSGISSPTQIPGTDWANVFPNNGTNATSSAGSSLLFLQKSNGSVWYGGMSPSGSVAMNAKDAASLRSSPTQLGAGTAWAGWTVDKDFAWMSGSYRCNTIFGVTNSGELWAVGGGTEGELGVNDRTSRSSPIQIPGTWSTTGPIGSGYDTLAALKEV